MLFHLTGIKDISDKNYTLEVLIEGPDQASIKHFLSLQKIIVLGLEHYDGDPQLFGNTYFILAGENQNFKIITQFEKLEEAVAFIVKLELKIINANYSNNPLPADQVTTLIQKIINADQEAQASLKKEQEKAAQKARLNFNDKKLAKSYDAIDQIINQIDQLLEIGGNNLLPVTLKKLDNVRGEISKLRLAANYDKIIEELHKAMNLIIETQDYLLERLESEKIFTIVPESKITNVQVIREQTRLAKAQLLTTLGAQLSREETMYASLGPLKIYADYLHQDIKDALADKVSVVREIYQGFELMLLFMLIEIAVLSVFSEQLGIGLSLQRFGIVFIYVSVLAGIFRVVNEYVKFSKPQHYLRLAGAIAAVYALILWLINIILVL